MVSTLDSAALADHLDYLPGAILDLTRQDRELESRQVIPTVATPTNRESRDGSRVDRRSRNFSASHAWIAFAYSSLIPYDTKCQCGGSRPGRC
jgi:hypothetical protein